MTKAKLKEDNSLIIKNYLIVKKQEPELVENARLGLELSAEIKELTTTFDEVKEFFRDHADGEQFNLVVPGVGSVSVKTPAAAASGTSVNFDENAFNALPVSVRRLLLDKGVVKTQSWSRPASAAAVTFTLNK